MSNREELNQRISSFNSLLEKMKIDPETIKIKVIKDNFGSTCEIKDKVKDGQVNYNLSLYGSDWNFNNGLESNCMINYSYKIIYHPGKEKMMSIVLGQECTFGTDPNIKPYYCYDEDMINSFRFY